MATHRNINKGKYVEINIDGTEAIITKWSQKWTNKQTNKQRNKGNKQINKKAKNK